MAKEFDLTKEYGIVLEGGGAKGAYQIGVWKALLECGVKIKGVSGVSVGALNGALMCMGDYEAAEELWKNLTYSDIMNVNDKQMQCLMKKDIKNLDLKSLTKDTTRVITERGIDVAPLKELINKLINVEKIKQSGMEFVFGTFLVDKLKELEITAQEIEEENLKDYLLASALLPAFKREKLNGQRYLDGGMFNNVPVDMLINRNYKDIIIIRIFGMGLLKSVKIPEDVTITQISPRINLGGMLEFNSEKSRRNIDLGYFDGLRSIRGLSGKIYYLKAGLKEEEAVMRLIHINEAVKMAFLEYYKLDFGDAAVYTRRFLEGVCQNLANSLRLQKNWTYHELYLSLLELAAKTVHISKFAIYTEEELIKRIRENYEKSQKRGYEIELFLTLVIKLIILPPS